MARIRGKNRKITLEQVYDRANIEEAVRNARRNKKENYGVRKFDEKYEENIERIIQELKTRTYTTSKPKLEKRFCTNKWRILAKVKYYDNVVEHALMQVVGPVLDKSYYYETAASIKGRGVTYLVKHIKRLIDLNLDKDIYVGLIDFVKCYYNVVREKIYECLCHEFDNDGIRYLIRDIIYALGEHNGLEPSDGKRGVALGIYSIQPFVNFYFNDLGRGLAKIKGIKPFIYSDNIAIIGFSPEAVQKGIDFVRYYASDVLEQPIHENIGIQKVDGTHGFTFIGRHFLKGAVLISHKTKTRFKRKNKRYRNNREQWHSVMASYKGILQNVDGLHLWQTVTGMNKFSDFNLSSNQDDYVTTYKGKRFFNLPKIKCEYLTDKPVTILDYEPDCDSDFGKDRYVVVVDDGVKKYKFFTNNHEIKDQLTKIREMHGFPFETTIRVNSIQGKNGKNINLYYFT